MTDRRRFLLVTGGIVVVAVLVAILAFQGSALGRRRAALLRRIQALASAEFSAIDSENPPTPAEMNAATFFDRAIAKFDPDWRRRDMYLRPPLALDREWDGVPKGLPEWLEENGEVLALLEKAGAQERCWVGSSRNPWDSPWHALQESWRTGWYRGGNGPERFFELVRVRGRVALAEGRIADAARDAVLLHRLVWHLSHTPSGSSAYRNGRAEWSCFLLDRVFRRPDLDATTARGIAAGLLDLPRLRDAEPIHARRDALREFGYAGAFLDEGPSGRNDAWVRGQLGLGPESGPWRVSDADLDALEGILAKWKSEQEARAHGARDPVVPDSWTGRLLVLRAAFAVRAHQIDTGAPPAALSGLVPEYLAAVPLDPCADAPLSYEIRPGGWSIWSTGRISMGYNPRLGRFEDAVLRVDWPPR